MAVRNSCFFTKCSQRPSICEGSVNFPGRNGIGSTEVGEIQKKSLMGIPQKLIRFIPAAGIALAAGCELYPVHNRVLQVGLVIGLAMIWFGIWSGPASGKRWARVLLLVAPVLPALLFLLPDKPIDQNDLRDEYVLRLRGFEGTRYVWGGESPLGIDCSGLPRRAFRDVLWNEGCRHANGRAFRMWLAQWWFDASALAMRDGERGQTRPLGISAPLWELDRSSRIHPGDLAVRGDGGHVVSYLGGHQWIEADPNCGKVHIWVSSPNDGKWYSHMVLCRWAAFDPGG
jgi:hypothetical protein